MVEAKNFVEKELGKNIDETQQTETVPETKEQIPVYTPPPPQPQEQIPQVPQFFPQQPPVIQVIEKIVYKKQRIHGFFRTLTIIALLAIGFLMLGESTNMISLSINSFKLHQIFPIVIILSTIILRSYKGIFGKIFGLIIFLGVWGGMFTISVYTSLNPSSKWKSGEDIVYTIPAKNQGKHIDFSLKTLISSGSLQATATGKNIVGTRNSDRNLAIYSGESGKIEYLRYTEDNNRNLIEKYNSLITLGLPKDISFSTIYVNNFFGQHMINLKDISRTTFKFHAGIERLHIDIGDVISGNKMEIEGALADIQIYIPEDIGVMMYYKHIAGILDTPGFDALSGHYFQSQNIDKAKDILNLYINLGVGNTKINRVDTKNN